MATVLVVDDDSGVSRAFALFLEKEGHRALLASSAEEGLETAARERPELVFLDVRLPGISGLEALSRLGDILPDTPVVVMTGHGTLSTAVEAVRKGAFDYLPKPFTPVELRSLVARAFKTTGAEAQDVEAQKMPGGLFYMLGHTWLKTDKGHTAQVGVVHEFTRPLALFKQVELPEKGAIVSQGEMCAKIFTEDGFVHRIWSPAGGKVIEVNAKLKDEPSMLKTSPYQKGWLFRLETSNLEEDTKGLILSK